MEHLNRNAISVSAKKPMIDWVNSMDPVHPIKFRIPLNYDESTIYLIEEIETEEDFEEWIRENYLAIFEEELFSWITDDSKWPDSLTYELFTKWIQVAYQSIVVDLNDDQPLKYDE
jgi:hypothetical protein